MLGASLGRRVRVVCLLRQYHRAPPRGRPVNRAGKPAGPVLAPGSSESPSPPDLFNRAWFTSLGRSGRIDGKSMEIWETAARIPGVCTKG